MSSSAFSSCGIFRPLIKRDPGLPPTNPPLRCPDFEGIENENYSPMIVLYSPKNFRCGARRSAFSLFVAVGLVTSSVAQTDSPAFGFPPGVDWNSATPEQMVQSVFDAAKNNPDAAADIAAAGVLAAAQTGRWPREGSQDGKQTTDPDGSGGDPTIEDVAQRIADAAKQANPAMAPQIDAAVAGALASLPVGGALGGSGPAGTGDPGAGTAPLPPAGFGGGGGSSGSSSASN